MKTLKALLLFIFLAGFILSGCVAIDSGINSDFDFDDFGSSESVYGSGNIVVLEEAYSGFVSLELNYSFNAHITQGDYYSVTLRLDDNMVDYLTCSQHGEKLILSMKSGYNYKNVTLEADITMPDINRLELNGASYALFKNIGLTHNMDLKLSGASRVDGQLNTKDLYVNVSGASSVEFTGEAANIFIDCSGASHINFRYFKGNNAVLELSGASVSTLNITGTIRANLSGASVLYYTGNPVFAQLNTSGQSRVIRI